MADLTCLSYLYRYPSCPICPDGYDNHENDDHNDEHDDHHYNDLGIVYFRIKHEYFFYIESYTFWIGDGALINSS